MARNMIGIHGIWMYLWGAWITSILGWMFWGPQFFGHDVILLGLRIIFTWFFIQEICGAVVEEYHMRRGHEEWATTLSQFMQRLHQSTRKGTPWWKSWNALGTGFAVLVSYAAGLAFWEVTPVLGVGAGLTIFLWNLYHWINPEKYG